MSVIIFLAVLFVLVLVHELGHFAAAKWFGMRVDEFGIGFPPKLFGIKRGETEYTFNLFPVGGFVKIFGEDGADAPSSPVANEASDYRSEAITKSDKDGEGNNHDTKNSVTVAMTPDSRSFTGKSKKAQVIVLLAGITMNVLFAWFLVVIAYSVGVQGIVDETEAGNDASLVISGVLPNGPAADAKLLPGTVVHKVAVGNTALDALTPSTFSGLVANERDQSVTIMYTYKDVPGVVELIPRTGIIADEPDRYAIGVSLSLVGTVERTFFESVKDATMYVLYGIRDITVGLGGLLADAFQFKADFSQVAGPVGIVGLVGEASAYGVTTLLMFTAFISLNLAVINALPFPALDGGRVLFVIIEAVKGSPIPARIAGTVNMIGFVLLIALMVAVTWNDIARLL